MRGVSSYDGKFALVTGSRRGIGKIITEHILQNGGFVAGFAKGESTIDHPNYYHYQVDISDYKAIRETFFELQKITEKIHILVNNAGVLNSQYAMIMPVLSAQLMINVNLMGAFVVSREASKMMRKSKWGRIINISSMAASLEPIGDSIYCASKAGLAAMSNVMAKELAPLNITCNTLAITAIETDMMAKIPHETIQRVVSSLPIPRFAKPDDIFNVLDFMVSERSSYITAQTIYLGGVN